MTLSEQIHKTQARLKEKPDPLLAEVLKSLEKLERLNTVDGLIEFHQREYCSVKEAAEYLGCFKNTALKNVKNFFVPKDQPNRIKIRIPAIAVGKEGKPTYIVVKRGLKPLKQKYQP